MNEMHLREVVITDDEKNAALLRIRADLTDWYRRNPDETNGREAFESKGDRT